MFFASNPLTLEVSQLETPPWIILGICFIGIYLAYATEEGHLLFHPESEAYYLGKSRHVDEDLKKNEHRSTSSSLLSAFSASLENIFDCSWIFQCIASIIPSVIIKSLEPCYKLLSIYKMKFDMYRTVLYLKRIATSKRHFFYLLEKKTLDIPIDAKESEIDSYLDCKRHIGKTWPFMWEVSNVAKQKVTCDGYDCIPMSSYSYLDLLRNEQVQEAAIAAAKQWATGNHGPRMLGGNMKILMDLEYVIAKFFGREDTLLCATGYLACMSACAAVATESTVIFGDSRLHASLRAGLKIGDAKVIYFKHNDFKACEEVIKKHRSKFLNSWMVIESVYSMDGDLGDLPAAHALCQKYDIKLIIDEAHGLGVIGPTGRGLEEHYNMPGSATLIVGTFSKSVASIGGYITGPKYYINYLDFHAPGNVFSAPLPAYCAGGAIKSFQIMTEHPELTLKAQRNSKFLRDLLKTGANCWPENFPESSKYIVEGSPTTTVIPIIFRDDIDRVLRVATRLKTAGFMCSAVAYPACPLRTPRFRITGTTAYTEEVMVKFVETLVRVTVEEKPSIFANKISLFQ